MTSLRKLGSSDLEVFPLSLGGNVFGWTADEAQSFAVLDAYTAGGGNFVDTADGYSAWVPGHKGGESETVIGKWFAARGNRSDVVLATKVSTHPEYKGLSPANIRAAADASLRRLGTDYIDLYYTHFDDTSVPVEEIIGALDELVRAGKVREIAASNISAERLAESVEFSDREVSRATSPSSRTTTSSRATPTRARSRRSPPGPAWPPSRTSRSRPASSLASTARVRRSSPRGPRARASTSTPSAASASWPPSTRSPWPMTPRSPRSPSPGSPPGRRSRRPSPPHGRSSSCRPCWRSPT